MNLNIEEKITIKLTAEELKQLLTEYLRVKGYETKNISFQIRMESHDPLDRSPDSPVFKGVEIDASKNTQTNTR